MNRRRLLATGASAAIGLSFALAAQAEPPTETIRMRLFADTDDDDGDGASDRDGTEPGRASDVRWMDGSKDRPLILRSIRGTGVRVILGSKAFTESSLKGSPSSLRVGFQGLEAGHATVEVGEKSIEAAICEFVARDPSGRRVDLAKSHASLSRTLPPVLAKQADGSSDHDALSWNVICPAGIVPKTVSIASTRSDGRLLDSIESARIETVPCPEGTRSDLECGATRLIRATSDIVDRSHPSSVGDSLRAEVGGRIVLRVEGHKAASIRVGGPRRSAVGALERFRARLRFHVVRASVKGAVSIGGNEAGAVEVLRSEIRTANALWGQCGIVFGEEDDLEIAVVDPPEPHLIAIGCDAGLPASGGRIAFSVDGRPIAIETRAAESPVQVAHAVAAAARAAGFVARVSPNARISPGAQRTADVLVKRRNGDLARLAAQSGAPLSDDSTLTACLGEVDLADGLSHFSDLDAVAGTVEERSLVKAYLDDDPGTVDVFVVPSFSRTGRIGESFIDADRSSIQNAVIIDRAGIRAGARSFALAHEIGHILLDMPGHPDDFGVDRPWVLMDADAADPTIFGPRRLPLADCERAVVQSGPSAPVPLLTPWPLYGEDSSPD